MNTKVIFKSLFLSLVCLGLFFQVSTAQCGSTSKNNQHRNYKSANTSHEKDIVGFAASQSNLSTLVAAVKAAGLVETLHGKGPFIYPHIFFNFFSLHIVAI